MNLDAATIRSLKAGDVLEAAVLLPGLDATEQLVWQVLESEPPLPESPLELHRVTLRGSYHAVYVATAIATADKFDVISWRVK